MSNYPTRSDIEKLIDENDNQLPAYAWPGGYPLFYVTNDSGVLCQDCANMALKEGLINDEYDPQWYIISYDINYEDTSLYCDHCSKTIESAYGDDEDDQSEDDQTINE